MSGARVVSVAKSGDHRFSKNPCERLELEAGLGVKDDAHAGQTVQHLSRIRRDPRQPNLRQVHLIHAELFDELAPLGFVLAPGDLGENILTRGVELLALPTDTRLRIGTTIIRVTGLRNPCAQIEAFRHGLLAHMVRKRADGSLERRCGMMGVVEAGGTITVGDAIAVDLPPKPHRPLEPV